MKTLSLFLFLSFCITICASCTKSAPSAKDLLPGTWILSQWAVDSNRNSKIDPNEFLKINVYDTIYIFSNNTLLESFAVHGFTWSLVNNDLIISSSQGSDTYHIDNISSSGLTLKTTDITPINWLIYTRIK